MTSNYKKPLKTFGITLSLVLILALILFGQACSRTSPTTSSAAAAAAAAAATTAVTTTITTTTTTTVPANQASLDKIGAAIEGLTSYKLVRNTSTDKVDLSDQINRLTLRTYSEARLNLTDKQMSMRNVISAIQSGSTKSMIENNLYIKDDILYVQGIFPSDLTAWRQTELGDEYWQTQNQAARLFDLLQGQTITTLPEETLDGVIYEVWQTTPDLQSLWENVVGEPGVQIPDGPPEGISYADIVKNAQLLLWTEQNSGRPLKAKLTLDFLIEAEMIATATTDVSMNISIFFEFSEFNQTFSINPPTEALNSEPLSLNER